MRGEKLRVWFAPEDMQGGQIVFEQDAPCFRDSLNPRGATFDVRPVIEQIIASRTPELTGNQSRFLIRRGLITAEGTFAFPILGRWLNESAKSPNHIGLAVILTAASRSFRQIHLSRIRLVIALEATWL